jgi:hypothetical protein
MKIIQINKVTQDKEKITLHTAISDVERFLREYKVENISKWKTFKKILARPISKAR